MAALECSRFVLLDECPANAESWFLARTFDALLASDVRGVVSFADPNAAYTGRATARTIKLLPDGTVLNSEVRAGSPRLLGGCEPAFQQEDRTVLACHPIV